jgi:RNA polymerase sigma factor (sigma-70 family)
MEESKQQRFIEALETNKERLFRICRSYALTTDDAKDLFQEVLVNAWKALPGFKEESQMTTWIYRITLNVCMRAREFNQKRNSHFVRMESINIEPADHKPYDVEKEAKLTRLHAEINRMTQPDKSIILLYLENLAYKEIANITGLTENNIAVRIKRMKSKLLIALTT